MQPNPFLYLIADRHGEDVLSEASERRRTFSEADLARIRQRMCLPAVLAPLCALVRWLTREFTPTPQAIDLESHAGRPLSIYGPR